MRPVSRGPSPQVGPFDPYETAKISLLRRLGLYCSYCERRVETNLAIEHIEPKGLPATAHLETVWTNFLLACVNCNSTKGHKPIVLNDVILPDRDNTSLAYHYTMDGRVEVIAGLPVQIAAKAATMLALTGLDRNLYQVLDDNGVQIVVDRVSKRMEVRSIALMQAALIAADPANLMIRASTVVFAQQTGCFSVWMSTFSGDPDMQERLIDAFPGTRQSGCFGAAGSGVVSPHPNSDGLRPGGRL